MRVGILDGASDGSVAKAVTISLSLHSWRFVCGGAQPSVLSDRGAIHPRGGHVRRVKA